MKNSWMSILKYIFIGINVLFVITGSFMVHYGNKAIRAVEQFKEIFDEKLLIPPTTIVIFGWLLIAVSLIACYGVLLKSSLIIRLHFLALCVLLTAEVIALIVLTAYRKSLLLEVDEKLRDTFNKHGNGGAVTPTEENFWIELQKNVKCCGLLHPYDWIQLKSAYPDVCCVPPQPDCSEKLYPNFHATGCFVKIHNFIDNNTTAVCIFAMGLVLMQMIIMYIGLLLDAKIRQDVPPRPTTITQHRVRFRDQ